MGLGVSGPQVVEGWHGISFWLGMLAFGIDTGFVSAIFVEAVVGFGVAIPAAPGFIGTFHEQPPSTTRSDDPMLAAQRIAEFNRTRVTLKIDSERLHAAVPGQSTQSVTYTTNDIFLVAQDPGGKHWVLYRVDENRLLSSGKTFLRVPGR